MSQEQTVEPTLTLKDRINYPYILANTILAIHKMMLNPDFTIADFSEAIQSFLDQLPNSWQETDKKWKKALKNAMTKRKVDVRPKFCGIVASEQFCKAHGVNPFTEKEEYDYHKLYHACIDLLDRRGLISKKTFTEVMTGKPFVGAMEDIADTSIDEV